MTFCSLITQTEQAIAPGVYTAVRFEKESTDAEGWHASTDLADPASALIIPKTTTVALLAGAVFWANDNTVTQYLQRFTRDPYDPDLIDSTATHDRSATPGAEYEAFTWPMTIRTGQPLALMIGHNSPNPQSITLAEFKVWVP